MKIEFFLLVIFFKHFLYCLLLSQNIPELKSMSWFFVPQNHWSSASLFLMAMAPIPTHIHADAFLVILLCFSMLPSSFFPLVLLQIWERLRTSSEALQFTNLLDLWCAWNCLKYLQDHFKKLQAEELVQGTELCVNRKALLSPKLSWFCCRSFDCKFVFGKLVYCILVCCELIDKLVMANSVNLADIKRCMREALGDFVPPIIWNTGMSALTDWEHPPLAGPILEAELMISLSLSLSFSFFFSCREVK